jgi:hypothetical protein
LKKQVADGSLISMLMMEALAHGCCTSPFSLADHPYYTGPYPYLARACHLLERYDFMVLWLMFKDFDLCFGGIANSEAWVPIRMLLKKLCFDAHCLVARFPGCPMLRG